MKRGIVVPVRFEIDRPRMIKIHGGIDDPELRKLLLYWDEIVSLVANGLGARVSKGTDFEMLQKEGILKTYDVFIQETVLSDAGIPTAADLPQARLGSFTMEHALVHKTTGYPQIDAAIQLQMYEAERREKVANVELLGFAPEQLEAAHQIGMCIACGELNERFAGSWRWSILHDFSVGRLIAGSKIDRHAVEVALIDALPVPAPDTPIEKVLKFRDGHQPELLRLRAALSVLGSRVVGSDDPKGELVAVTDEIDAALAGIARALEKSPIQRTAETLKAFVSLNPGHVVPALLGAGLLSIGQPLAALAAVGVSAGLKVLTRDVKLPDSLAENYGDFAYVYGYRKKLK